MASLVLAGQEFRWPAGTTVKAYPASGFPQSWKASDGVPANATLAGSGVVAANGSLTIAGLTAGVRYKLHSDTVDRWAESYCRPPVGSRPNFATADDGGVAVWDAAANVYDTSPLDAGCQALHSKLAAGLGGSIVCAGDSTWDCATAGEVPELMAAYFAGLYPLMRVELATWASTAATDYPAVTVVQAGDGAHGTLNIWNCSVGSQTTQFFLAPYLDVMVARKLPDVIFFNIGHNDTTAAADTYWWTHLSILVESWAAVAPNAEIILCTQNGRADASAAEQAKRRHITKAFGRHRGYLVIDTYRRLLDSAGAVDTTLLLDAIIHPSAVGEALMFEEIVRHIAPDAGRSPRPQSAPSLLEIVPASLSGLLNSDFAAFAVPPTLTSWTATNCTLSKDVTNKEGPNGWSVRMQSASAALAYMTQGITGDAIRQYLGQWVMFLARMRIPSGANANCGRVSLFTTGAAVNPSVTSFATLQGQGGFRWVGAMVRVPVDAGTLSCRIFAENGTTGTGDVSAERCVLVKGVLPRDLR